MSTASQDILIDSTPEKRQTLRFLSYNVRYDSMPDDISVNESINNLYKGLPSEPKYHANWTEQPWSTRRLHIANDILFNHIDIFGGQELLKRQVDDLALLLGPTFEWVGVGRDDGNEKGEFAAVFYNTSSVTLESFDNFWLSDTPFEASKYWNAGSYRVCTTTHFRSTSQPSRKFTVLNTHLDEQSADQRVLGASLILHRAKYEAIKTRRPVILTGDFNSPPSDSAYQVITGAKTPVQTNQTFAERYSWTEKEGTGFEDFMMRDLLGEVEPRYRIGGNFATFTDFLPLRNTSEFSRIDYIMASNHGGWTTLNYRIGDNVGDDGVYHSDHRPVMADIDL